MFNLNIKPTKVYRFAIKPSYVVMSQVLHACILYDDDDDDDAYDDGRPGPRRSSTASPPPLKSCTNYKRAPIDNLKKKRGQFHRQFVTVSGSSLHTVESFSRSYQSLSWPRNSAPFMRSEFFATVRYLCQITGDHNFISSFLVMQTAGITGSLHNNSVCCIKVYRPWHIT